MENDKIKKGIVRILLANILNLLFSLGTNFLLPKYISVDTYAQIKTYQLYISYVAILQLGYSDGMYLSFGGKELSSIPYNDIQTSISTMRVFQAIITIISSFLALFIGDKILFIATVAIFPQNIIAYYKNLFQAVGTFDKYSSIMNYTTGLTFAINIVLLFILKSDSYMIYILSYLGLTVFLSLKLEISIRRTIGIKYGLQFFSINELCEKVKSGFLLLLANFSSILLTSMDRWFTKILLGLIDFAHYSFAVSIENFLNVAVSPITVTMYNYFCNNPETEKHENILKLIMGFSTLLISVAFPIKFIIIHFLNKYTESINTIFILFSAQMFLIVIRSVYSNLYKAMKMQREYFLKMVIVIISGAILNYLCFIIMPRKEAFAFGTLFSSIEWFFLCTSDFKNLRLGFRKISFLILECLLFLAFSKYNPIIGFLMYIALTLLNFRLFLPNVLTIYMNMLLELVSKFFKKFKYN